MLMFLQAGVPCQWVNDGQRFLLECLDTIHNSPSQIYHSALPLCPSSFWLREYYTTELSKEVKVVKGLSTGWGTCSYTTILDQTPQALACWKDIIAAGLESGDIIILNGITGSQRAVLSGHTDWARSLTFLPDGKSLISGSDDQTLKLWDLQTGGVVKTFHGHTHYIFSISTSSDCTTIVSGSADETIRVWDIQTGECHRVIEGQGQVCHTIFSPTNPQHFISAAGAIVQGWDINGCKVGPTHGDYCAALSPDASHFISFDGGAGVATVKHFVSGGIIARFPMDNSYRCCCFSPNGRLVAVAVEITVYVWDITGSDPLLIETFVGDTFNITSLAFYSPSTLISASDGKSVKFWHIDGLLANLNPKPPTSAPIQSISLQAEHNITISSDFDGVVMVWDISTGLCKASFQTPAKGDVWRDAQVIGGRLIFVWLEEEEIHVWDTNKDKLLKMVEVDCEDSGGLRISGDGSKIFLHAGEFIQAWTIWTGEVVGEVVGGVEEGDVSYLDPLCAGGSRIWVLFDDKPAQGWDFGVLGSSSAVPLSNTERPRLHFIYDFWSSSPARIEDTATGEEVFRLPGRYGSPVDVRWDGQYLVAGYQSGEVLILDFNHLS
jgi:WD40 repeat protein